MECSNTGIVVVQTQESCKGEYTSNLCIIHPQAISELDLPINSSQNQINIALVEALVQKDLQIQSLIQRVESLENQ